MLHFGILLLLMLVSLFACGCQGQQEDQLFTKNETAPGLEVYNTSGSNIVLFGRITRDDVEPQLPSDYQPGKNMRLVEGQEPPLDGLLRVGMPLANPEEAYGSGYRFVQDDDEHLYPGRWGYHRSWGGSPDTLYPPPRTMQSGVEDPRRYYAPYGRIYPPREDMYARRDGPADMAIKNRIKNVLRSIPADANSIHVSIYRGNVALVGPVLSEQTSRQAQTLVRELDGVETFQSRLFVTEEPPAEMSDRQMQDRIEDALYWCRDLDSDFVDVSVDRGVAILTGVVPGWNAELAAVECAYHSGASRVRSRLAYATFR